MVSRANDTNRMHPCAPLAMNSSGRSTRDRKAAKLQTLLLLYKTTGYSHGVIETEAQERQVYTDPGGAVTKHIDISAYTPRAFDRCAPVQATVRKSG